MTGANVVADHGDLAAARTPAPTPGPQAAAARSAVIGALRKRDDVLAAWEAGSAAFGRADLASDLDVGVIALDGAGTEVLDAVEEQLADLTDLVLWDVGESKFGVQRFWQPAQPGPDAPFCLVDVSVMERDAHADELRELLTPERHGRALAMHDPDGVLAETIAAHPFDAAAHRARIQVELDRLRARHELFATFGPKELARGRRLDAHWIHQGMVVVPLVALLGMVHRPLRFDFGLRYLHDELPPAIVECLEPIVEPGRDRLAAAIDEGIAWIDELVDSIDPDLLPIERHAAEMRTAFG
ncbi:MAG: polymerase beta domain protein region [Thermoleophilia bacterium]|nr:polymerase beta domain protein region [Thermoleophilia bacterium]